MNKQNHYSDEHINAYIDGELDTDDRTRLLFDEQHDAALSQRINDARVLKEKVQLAYADLSTAGIIRNPVKRSTLFNSKRSLVAGIAILLTAAAFVLPAIIGNNEIVVAQKLIKNTPLLQANAIAKTIGSRKKVVINISQYQADDFDNTIENIENILQEHQDDSTFKIELVAHKAGLKALDTKTSRHVEQITLLSKRFDSFDVVACAKSMADLATAGDPIQLMKSILITPSAAEQVARRTNQGWMYLKL
jgi:intracellular sulfur oxidation DsrE/DsrF family protein